VYYGDGAWSPEVIYDPELGQEINGRQYVGGETEHHKAGKRLIMQHLRDKYPDERVKIDQELRVYVHNHKKYRIADVAASSPSGLIEVHEVQFAPLSVEDFEARDDDYSSQGVSTVWWLGGEAAKNHELKRSIRRRSLSLGFFEEVK
jgi:competence CoiA-like predicted nuclease